MRSGWTTSASGIAPLTTNGDQLTASSIRPKERRVPAFDQSKLSAALRHGVDGAEVKDDAQHLETAHRIARQRGQRGWQSAEPNLRGRVSYSCQLSPASDTCKRLTPEYRTAGTSAQDLRSNHRSRFRRTRSSAPSFATGTSGCATWPPALKPSLPMMA